MGFVALGISLVAAGATLARARLALTSSQDDALHGVVWISGLAAMLLSLTVIVGVATNH